MMSGVAVAHDGGDRRVAHSRIGRSDGSRYTRVLYHIIETKR